MPKINTLSVDGMTINSIERRPDSSQTGPIDAWQLVALHEILVELRRLNSLLHCHNFVAVPSKLERIARNTAKPRAPRKRKVP